MAFEAFHCIKIGTTVCVPLESVSFSHVVIDLVVVVTDIECVIESI